MKLISIVTINYNNANALERTITSVVAFTDPALVEYIIVDGGSQDGSVEVIRNFANQIHIWTSEPDAGIYDAMNKGISKASGKYLWFINSGDTITDSQAFQHVVEACLSDNYDLVYGDILLTNGKEDKYRSQTDYIDLAYLFGKTINHQSYLLKIQYYWSLEYDLQYKIVADWVHLFTTLRNSKLSQFKIKYPLVKYDTTGFSSLNETARLEERTKFLSSLYTSWEMESLKSLTRLRSRSYYGLLIKSLGSKRKGMIISFLLKLMYPRWKIH